MKAFLVILAPYTCIRGCISAEQVYGIQLYHLHPTKLLRMKGPNSIKSYTSSLACLETEVTVTEQYTLQHHRFLYYCTYYGFVWPLLMNATRISFFWVDREHEQLDVNHCIISKNFIKFISSRKFSLFFTDFSSPVPAYSKFCNP